MSADVAQLSVVIRGDTEDAERKIGGINTKVKESGGFFKNALSNALGFAAGGAILNGVGAAVGFVASNLGDMVKQGMDGNRSMAILAQGLKSTHDASGMTLDSLDALSNSIMNMTGIDDDSTKAAEQMLLTFTGIGKDAFPAATQAAADMATRMNGGAIPSAQQMQQQALLLGKALNDPAKGMTALTREGVTFTDAQKQQIAAMEKAGNTAGAQKIILQELQKEFGGSAQAAGQANGGVKILAAQFDNMKQTVGQALIPILQQLMQAAQPIVAWAADHLPGALKTLTGFINGNVTPILKQLGGWFVSEGLPALQRLGSFIVSNVVPALQQLGTWAATHVLPILQTLGQVFITNIVPALQRVWVAISENLIPAIQHLWEKLSPVLIPALQFVGTILQNVVGPALGFIITVIGKVIDIVATVIGKIGDFIGWLGHAGDGAKALGGHFNDLLGVVKNVWKSITDTVQNAINTVIGWFKTAYEHSYVFKAIVDTIKADFEAARTIITNVWNAIVGFLQGVWNAIVGAARTAWGAFTGAIQAAIGAVQGAINNIVNAIKGPVQAIVGWIRDIGGQIIQGLINGVKAEIGLVGDIAKQIGNMLLNGVKAVLGIHSPSKEMHAIGQFLSVGLIQGVQSIDVAGPISSHLGGVTSDVSARLGVNVVGGGSNFMRPAVSAGGGSAGGSGGSLPNVPININIAGRTVAQVLLPEFVAEIRRAGIRI